MLNKTIMMPPPLELEIELDLLETPMDHIRWYYKNMEEHS